MISAEQAAWFHDTYTRMVDLASNRVVGKRSVIELAFMSLFARGHILIEDVPGVGKATLAETLASVIQGTTARITFTSDLLPSDVTGATIYNQREQAFEFHKGPVFANIVLAVGINRTPPRTQTALLEVLSEGRVTVDGIAHPVPRPFMVIATQNPVDQAGTYGLPDASLDRFLIRVTLGYPDHDSATEILRRDIEEESVSPATPLITAEAIEEMIALRSQVHVPDPLRSYIVRVADSTRTDQSVMVGVSVRGCVAMARAAQSRALCAGRTYVVPDDVVQLAEPVWAHRIILKPESEFRGITGRVVVDHAVSGVAEPIASE